MIEYFLLTFLTGMFVGVLIGTILHGEICRDIKELRKEVDELMELEKSGSEEE